jgi:hypothetical protein
MNGFQILLCFTAAAVLAFPQIGLAEESAKEPIKVEDARKLALSKAPGRVVRSTTRRLEEEPSLNKKEKVKRSELKKAFVFYIQGEDNSRTEVVISEETGEVLDIVYIKTAKDFKPPAPKITKPEAEQAAIKYVSELPDLSGGSRPPVAAGSEYGLYKGKPAYTVRVAKHMSDFRVYVDPQTAAVLGSQLVD